MESHAQRINELLSDGYLTGDRGSDIRLTPRGVARLHELIHDGLLYTAKREDNIQLTRMGLNVLMACADRPVKPKPSFTRVVIRRR